MKHFWEGDGIHIPISHNENHGLFQQLDVGTQLTRFGSSLKYTITVYMLRSVPTRCGYNQPGKMTQTVRWFQY